MQQSGGTAGAEAARSGRVLALSSQVAFGHVGLSAAVPVLQRLGVAVTPLPTVMLSNHPGWPHVAAHRVPVEDLRGMVEGLARNGWLARHDTVLTGYLPSAAHVELAAWVIDRLRKDVPDLRVVVDPVLGDSPKGLYIDAAAAAAIRTELLPRADIVTPNLYELGWLTGLYTETVRCTAEAAQGLGCRAMITSVPVSDGSIGVLEVGPEAGDAAGTLVETARLDGVPHGVGDVFSALIASGCTLREAMGHLSALIAASLGADHLRIVESAPDWAAAAPVPPKSCAR
ncbi:bifunctional hydroxymethylpyrimidine kinase/phosphomethylpyrimidine kinase [Marinibacterium profundimaris]|uniref:bifunctional hydroxymethylpyrimidine kinase/phosphomethylpyrimidine kinase n=1 Tax=Marinibacterium profundimaris TaxID=1679460 RepID=UPI0013036266|nr:bifunctional hydroxymethylpyrimidine kinase/phosphomethylpyrimidine kinase [Marinibacterium profundimaris]